MATGIRTVHPHLFTIAGFDVPAYGLALALAFLCGIGWAHRRARRRGLDAEITLEVGIVAIVCALLGARLFYLALHPEVIAAAGGLWPALAPSLERGRLGQVAGLSVMGGLPAAVIGVLALLAVRRQDLLPWADLLSPCVALGAAITRLGCFGNGCCFGTYCAAPWAVAFPAGSLPHQALGDAALHPTQLYASLAGLAITGGLLGLERRRPAPGVVFAALLGAMGAQRFGIEFFRHHDGAETFTRLGDVPISHYQLAALGLCAVGLVVAVLASRHASAR